MCEFGWDYRRSPSTEGMKTPTITIDMDKKCKRCDKGGATDAGYCMKCICKNLEEGKYGHILKPYRGKTEKGGNDGT